MTDAEFELLKRAVIALEKLAELKLKELNRG